MAEPLLISDLIHRYTQPGVVRWIGLRSSRRGDVVSVERVEVTEGGLEGDHRAKPGKRAVTFIQREHLDVIAALTGRDEVLPELLRRNIVVSGINLLGLRDQQFRIGNAVFEGGELCVPCSRMEEIFGHGGYAAVRGHGGITASVVTAGTIAVGDMVTPVED